MKAVIPLSTENLPRSEPLEICMVTPYFYPVFAGASERFRRYAPGLARRGVHLRVVTPEIEGYSTSEVIDQISIRRVCLNRNHHHKTTELLKIVLKDIQNHTYRPNVLQVFSASVHSLPYLLQAKLRGVSPLLIVTMTSRNPDTPSSTSFQHLKTYISNQLRLRPFSRVVASSAVIAKELLALGVASHRVEIIPNGVDISYFRPPESDAERILLRSELGFSPEDEIILFVGLISPRKGIDLLTSAWSAIVRNRPNAKLVLIGPRRDEDQDFCQALDEQIAHSAAPDRVVFKGYVTNVETYMRIADVFVFPSLREGMGNVVLEAMASGLPCLLTPYDGLPQEFGRPDREYLLVMRDANALSRITIQLLEDKPTRQLIGYAARHWIEQHLDMEKSLDQYARLYKEASCLASTSKG